MDTLASLLDPYAHGLDVLMITFGTQWLAIESHAHVIFQAATVYEVTFCHVGTESRSGTKISPLASVSIPKSTKSTEYCFDQKNKQHLGVLRTPGGE